ncbi:unnamed protein product [Ectocarpus sp. 12 AP-2014]
MVNLHDLASKGDLEGVRKFLTRSAAKINNTDKAGRTPLHLAAKGGHLEVCRELLASVASVDIEDTKHTTPLLLAVENNRAKVAQVLCEAGASTSVGLQTSDGRSPLHIAANKGFVECAEVLLRHGATIDTSRNKWGFLPEEDCVASEIRFLIAAARQERDAAGPVAGAAGSSPFNPYAASAPPPMEERKEGVGFPSGCSSPQAPPSYHESVSPSQITGAEGNT